MKSIFHLSIGILFVALAVSGFCQVLSPSQVHSVSPSVWVLKGDGEVFVLPKPTPLPNEIVIDLPGLPEDATPLVLVRIPAGSFMMGRYAGEQDSSSAEDPQHQVTISQDFYLGKYEVTKAQWTAVMGTTPWSGYSYILSDPNSPAAWISWNDCQNFVTELNKLSQGTFRLPSEAEWEYACRAGTTTRFYWGDDSNYSMISDYAWWRGNAYDANERYAHVVGLKLPNAWGLYDMSGNVLEWCHDWYGTYPSGAVTDPAGPASGSYRVLRGGFSSYYAHYCRSVSRSSFNPYLRLNYLGLRIMRTQ